MNNTFKIFAKFCHKRSEEINKPSEFDKQYGRAVCYLKINDNLYWFIYASFTDNVLELESMIPANTNKSPQSYLDDLTMDNTISKACVRDDFFTEGLKIIESNVTEMRDDFSSIRIKITEL